MKHSNLFLKRLRELAYLIDECIREGVSHNINSDEDLLDILSKHKSWSVRESVSLNEKTSE